MDLRKYHSGDGPTETKAVANRRIKAMAQSLGNTPAVCRTAYVTPLVFEAHAYGA
jgi:DNA topoisomerase IB